MIWHLTDNGKHKDDLDCYCNPDMFALPNGDTLIVHQTFEIADELIEDFLNDDLKKEL